MGLRSVGKRFLLGADIKKVGGNGESMKGISWFRTYWAVLNGNTGRKRI